MKSFRKSKGLSQEQLAEAINVHSVTVSRWENNELIPKTVNIQQMARILGVSEAELLNGTPEQPAQWVLHIKIAHEFKEEVIDMTKSIPRDASIITTPKGGYLCLGGDYSLWTDDNNFKKFLADIKKFRATVIQNGVAFGSIKQ